MATTSKAPAFRNERPVADPEIIPRDGTWQREAYDRGQRFYGTPGPNAEAVIPALHDAKAVAVETLEPTPLDIGHPAMTETVEIGDNIIQGYN